MSDVISESFILFKPDALNNPEIMAYVYDQLVENQLFIFSKSEIKINEEDIQCLWPHSIQDTICRLLLVRYLCQDNLLFLRLKGKDCLNKVKNIKKCVRKRFKKSVYANCIHAPINSEELNKDLAWLIYGVKTINVVDNSKQFYKASDEEILECVDLLWECLQSNLPDQMKDCYIEANSEYYLNLLNDNENELSYIAASLYELFPNWSLFMVYCATFLTDHFDSFPIFSSNDYNEVIAICRELCKLNIKFEVTYLDNNIHQKVNHHSI